jgi:copper chaperone CopZ
MSCAACSARVEKAVSSLDGVDSCSVNLLTNSMVVEGSVTDEEIISAVVRSGYGATKKGEKVNKSVPFGLIFEDFLLSRRVHFFEFLCYFFLKIMNLLKK